MMGYAFILTHPGTPFVFWDDLAEGCRQAKELGFDAVEVFPPSVEAVDTTGVRKLTSYRYCEGCQ